MNLGSKWITRNISGLPGIWKGFNRQCMKVCMGNQVWFRGYVNTRTTNKKTGALRRSNRVELTHGQDIVSVLANAQEPQKDKKHLQMVTSITVGQSIDLDKAMDSLRKKKLGMTEVVIPGVVTNLMVDGHDLMLLSNGTLVGWGMEETTMANFVPEIEEAIDEKYQYESEDMEWVQLDSEPETATNSGKSYMKDEVMVLQGNKRKLILLDMAAFAVGFSRSTRLSVLENALESHLQLTRVNSEYLSVGKPLTIAESDVHRLTGRLFLLRGKLNLYSELIETPDLYWTEPALEAIYESVSRKLDVSPRISILNRKLDYAIEEQRAWLSVLNEKKGTRLEWIIIGLIMLEVAFEMFHFYEDYKHDNLK